MSVWGNDFDILIWDPESLSIKFWPHDKLVLGTALTILATLKGTDAEIGSAWVQQHVKTFAEGFLSQVTFRDWSADQAKKNWSGPPVGWVLHFATTRVDRFLEVEYIVIHIIIYIIIYYY